MTRPIILFWLLLVFSPMIQAQKIAGIEMPAQLPTIDIPLHLNGAGARVEWFVDVYAAGLYLQEAQHDAQRILAADEPMAIRMHILTDLLTSKKITEAVREGFEKSTNGRTKPYESLIDSTLQAFAEEIKKHDYFDLVYLPGQGVDIYKNGTLLYQVESGLEFKQALFGIWLSERPVQERLKKAMLGK